MLNSSGLHSPKCTTTLGGPFGQLQTDSYSVELVKKLLFFKFFLGFSEILDFTGFL